MFGIIDYFVAICSRFWVNLVQIATNSVSLAIVRTDISSLADISGQDEPLYLTALHAIFHV